MKQSDLRVGNLVKYDGLVWAVNAFNWSKIYLDEIKTRNRCWVDHVDFIEPIVITPEWFEQAGFSNSDGVWWVQYHMENWGMQLIYFNNECIVRHGFMGDFTEITNLKYIHQLQNLYFALTGKELKFKPKEK